MPHPSGKILASLLALVFLTPPVLAAGDCKGFEDASHLVASGDLVIDKKSGLAWKSCLLGQTAQKGLCMGDAMDLSWLDADGLAKRQAAEAGSDWRLPTLEEIETMLDPECPNSPFFTAFHFGIDGEIWTASPGFPVNDVAAIINLQNGSIWGVGKGVSRYVWLVSGDPE